VFQSPTIAGLAAAIGVPAANLEATIGPAMTFGYVAANDIASA
jgi:hypothetical protein